MEKIRKSIEEAGWYESRKIDISYMIQDFLRHGFQEPNKLVQNFLAEYGNIRIEFRTNEGFCYDICINPNVGLQFLESEDSLILEKIAGDSLLPIGSVNSDHGGLLISFSGSFYLLPDKGLYYLGSDLLTTCESIFFRRPLIKLIGE